MKKHEETRAKAAAAAAAAKAKVGDAAAEAAAAAKARLGDARSRAHSFATAARERASSVSTQQVLDTAKEKLAVAAEHLTAAASAISDAASTLGPTKTTDKAAQPPVRPLDMRHSLMNRVAEKTDTTRTVQKGNRSFFLTDVKVVDEDKQIYQGVFTEPDKARYLVTTADKNIFVHGHPTPVKAWVFKDLDEDQKFAIDDAGDRIENFSMAPPMPKTRPGHKE